MKVLVIYPYSDKLLNALKDVANLNIGEMYLVGDKSQIIEKCYQNNIQTKLFTIYDINNDLDVIEFCDFVLKEGTADFILFDNFPTHYQNQILKCKTNREIGNIDILDLPFLNHFIFVSNYSQSHNIDFEDKKQAIIQASNLMRKLGIRKSNVGLITNLNNKTDILEASLISTILKENGAGNINVFDNFNIYNLFLKDSKVNVFKNNINLLILRNYESSRIFLDTLNVFTNTKMASLVIGKFIAVDVKNMKNTDNIVFALIILSKIYKANLNINTLNSGII